MYGDWQECDGMNRCCEEQREMNEKKKWQIQEKWLEAASSGQSSPGFISSGQHRNSCPVPRITFIIFSSKGHGKYVA